MEIRFKFGILVKTTFKWEITKMTVPLFQTECLNPKPKGCSYHKHSIPWCNLQFELQCVLEKLHHSISRRDPFLQSRELLSTYCYNTNMFLLVFKSGQWDCHIVLILWEIVAEESTRRSLSVAVALDKTSAVAAENQFSTLTLQPQSTMLGQHS